MVFLEDRQHIGDSSTTQSFLNLLDLLAVYISSITAKYSVLLLFTSRFKLLKNPLQQHEAAFTGSKTTEIDKVARQMSQKLAPPRIKMRY